MSEIDSQVIEMYFDDGLREVEIAKVPGLSVGLGVFGDWEARR